MASPGKNWLERDDDYRDKRLPSSMLPSPASGPLLSGVNDQSREIRSSSPRGSANREITAKSKSRGRGKPPGAGQSWQEREDDYAARGRSRRRQPRASSGLVSEEPYQSYQRQPFNDTLVSTRKRSGNGVPSVTNQELRLGSPRRADETTVKFKPYHREGNADRRSARPYSEREQQSNERGPRSQAGPPRRKPRARGQPGFDSQATDRSDSIQHKFSNDKDRSWKLRRLQLREIMSMCRLQPQELVNTLANNVKAFQATLQHNDTLSKPGIMSAIVQILSSLAKTLEPRSQGIPCTPPPQATQILAEAFSSRCPNFQLQLRLYVASLKRAAMDEGSTKYHATPQFKVQKVCTLFKILLTSLPESSWSCLPADELLESVQHLSATNPAVGFLIQQATEVVSLRDHVKQAFLERQLSLKQKAARPVEDWDNSEYRQVSILPQWEEVCISDPPAKLRENIVHGAYNDWMHYYDIQFRLLREDFVAPLRKGICEYLGGIRGRKLQNVKLYHNVAIVEPLFTKAGVCYRLQFDVSHFQRCNWEHSKRLIFGSLVCLSPDNFQGEIYFATVSNRDPKQLAEGKFEVQFEEDARILPLLNSATFTMVESLAYFEASRHILRSLQTAEVDTMPFTQYLIQGNCSAVSPPQYLVDKDTVEYNLNCLSSSHKESHSDLMQSFPDLRFDIRDITQWPTPGEIELDQSQLEAIQMALTQEIAVVQGPPGTGKTYIGLKIVEALLQNRDIWDPKGESPIFVMCLTNHALDQFLEGIMKLPGLHIPDPESTQVEECPQGKAKARIVRIGGRSQSELIKPFNIEQRRRQVYLPGLTLRNKRELEEMVRNPVKICKEWHYYLKSHFDPSKVSLLTLAQLVPFIDPDHLYQLQHVAESAEEEKMCLPIWLGLCEVLIWQEQPSPPVNIEGENEEESDLAHLRWSQEQLQNPPEEEVLLVPSVAARSDATSANNKPNVLQTYSEEGLQSKISEISSEEELVDILGEVAHEEAARMLDYEKEEFRSLVVSHDSLPGEDIQRNYGFHEAFHWHDDLESQTAEFDPLSEGLQHPPIPLVPAQPSRIVREQQNASEVFRWGVRQIPMTKEEADCVNNIHELALQARWRLYNHWASLKVQEMVETSETQFHEYNKLCKDYKESCHQADRFSLETADVIGMTTTGAAKYQHILHMVKPKIVIVEEAAEVLESHIVSALNAGTQHLILIGDHKQLRPKLNEFDLVRRFKLDISLFERLILKSFPHATLQIQHRMRPQIAQLVCPHIYSTLFNHSSVLEYGDVKGVFKNLFFIQHEFPEKEDANLISHANPHEADYISAFCKYLLQQDYRPSQITVLVTYSGQLLKVRKQMPKKDFEGVRVTTVDNFQGEENDIILLSLVRSNSDGKVGYLRESNRACVALSRAKVGFYCIGNFKMLRENVHIWERIVSDVEQRGCVGDGLQLYCSNHPDTKFSAASPKDFAKNAPLGGCTRDCEFRLSCGHVCIQKCHIANPAHTDYLCLKPCANTCPEGHPCPNLCHEKCTACKVQVLKQMSTCGHLQSMHCYCNPDSVSCKNPCSKRCPNKHPCPLLCYQACRPCTVRIPKVIPTCGHEQNVPCNLPSAEYDCMAECDLKCKNGHRCPKRCYQPCGNCCFPVEKIIPECGHAITLPCFQVPSHNLCDEPCERTLPCGHHCSLLCGEQCGKEPCKVRVTKDLACGHTKKLQCFLSSDTEALRCERPCEAVLSCKHPCQKKCSDPCTERCMKEVNKAWPCGHKLKRKCYQAQDPEKHPCQKACQKTLPCSHRCTNRCGESCTEKCKIPVEKKYPCSHVNKIACCATLKEFPCRQKCNMTLSCGHECEGLCTTCHSSRIHRPCKYGTKLTRFCGHTVRVDCLNLEDAHPGKKECTASCAHTKCSHDCTSECSPCTEPCAWKCPHYECSRLCHELCDRPPCNQRCQHHLKCGHQCFGVCGEPCLSICPLCPKGRKAFMKQLKETKEFKEDTVYVQLGCNHIFPVEYLDAYVTPKPVEDVVVGPKKCPVTECNHWISTSYRYGNAMKRSLQDVQAVRVLLKEEKGLSQAVPPKVQRIEVELDTILRDQVERKDVDRYSKEDLKALRESGYHQMKETPHKVDRRMEKMVWYRFKLYLPLTKTLISLKDEQEPLSFASINTQERFVLQLLVHAIHFLTAIDGSPVKGHVPTELSKDIGTVHHNVVIFIKILQQVIAIKSRLTQQLVEDLTSEHYRLALLIQYCDAVHPSTRTERSITTPQLTLADFLRTVQADPSKKVTEVEFYSKALSSSTLLSRLETLESPPYKKGLWYKCIRGHFYCQPPTRPGMVRQYSCPKCH